MNPETEAEAELEAEGAPAPEPEEPAPQSEKDVDDTASEAGDDTLAQDSEQADDDPDAPLPEGERLEALVQSAVALLFASPEPLSVARLRGLLEQDEPTGASARALSRAGVRHVLEVVTERFREARLPIDVREIAGGFRLMTDARLAEVVQRLDRTRKTEKISQAGLETLAIVAYRQPVSKAEIEAIRGVQAGPMLRQLVDRGLLRVTGRADQPGAPLLYGTTKEFLDRFGLASLDELPRDGELARD